MDVPFVLILIFVIYAQISSIRLAMTLQMDVGHVLLDAAIVPLTGLTFCVQHV